MADIINGIKSNVHTYVDVEKFDAVRDCGEQCANTDAQRGELPPYLIGGYKGAKSRKSAISVL